MKTLSTISLALLTLMPTMDARIWKDQDGRSMEADYVSTFMKGSEKTVIFTKDGMRVQVPLSRLSDQDQAYVAELEANGGQAPGGDTAKPKVAKTEFEQALAQHLVQRDGKRLTRVKDKDVGVKDYYAIYYSAHWCPPCRGFTPKLVDFYNDMAAKHSNFEVIFFSNDRSEEAMEGYITEYDMPFPAVDYGMRDRADELKQFNGRGIPCLVLVDRDGKVIKHSYVGDQYVGPTSVMKELERLLKQKQG